MINLRVFRGDIGFRILVKGTPLVGGEEFPCQITDGGKIPESGMDIFFTSSFPSENCTVEPILNLNTNLKATVSIYPNPIRDYLQIDFIGANNSRELIVIDNKGMEVISITNVQTQSYLLNTNELKTGHYMLVVKNNNAIESRNGFVVNWH